MIQGAKSHLRLSKAVTGYHGDLHLNIILVGTDKEGVRLFLEVYQFSSGSGFAMIMLIAFSVYFILLFSD